MCTVIEFGIANQQKREMVLRHLIEFGIAGCAKLDAFFEMLASYRVIFRFKFAETEKIPSGATGWSEFGQFAKRGDCVGETVAIVFERAKVEPSLLPVRFQFDGAAIRRDGLLGLSGVAGRGGCARDGLETVLGLRSARHSHCGRCQKREERKACERREQAATAQRDE